jgi:3-hydroxyacyl-CoA dehydrogenase / enoyl-CoA hydratase / 3-hydroxybutyryl-CoA epimerase
VEGARIEDIDGAMEAWGFPVGPLRLGDEVGLDVQAKIGVIMVDAFGERMQAPAMADRLVETDRRGRKNRRGFYAYGADGTRTGVDESVYADLGLDPTGHIPRSEIEERITLALIAEAARCLEDGILESATDGDVGAVLGIGYPPFRGGPFFTIDAMGAGHVVERLSRLADRHGPRFSPPGILVRAAEEGTSFRTA